MHFIRMNLTAAAAAVIIHSLAAFPAFAQSAPFAGESDIRNVSIAMIRS